MLLLETMPANDPALDELDDWESPPSSRSGVMPVATVRPDFDPEAYARESENRLAIASFIPTTPAPAASAPKVAVPATKDVSPSLRSLLDLEDPF